MRSFNMLFINVVLLSLFGMVRMAAGYEAPLEENPFATALPNLFIVKLEAGCTFDKHLEHINASPDDTYFKNATNLVKDLQLYFGYFPHNVLANIRSDVCVTSVSPDYLLTPAEHESREMSREEVSSYTRLAKRQARIGWKRISQRYAPWNLIMMAIKDKKSLDAFERPSRESVYDYVEDPGKGVDIYAFEADFNVLHPDFADRASILAINGAAPANKLGDHSFLGHGTKTASIAAGTQWGLAKKANIIFAHTKQYGHVFAALLKIKRIHQQKIQRRELFPGWRGSVISVTLGFIVQKWDATLAAEFQELDDLGVIVVTSAGNDLKEFSPENHKKEGNNIYCTSPGTLCVGGVDRAYWKYSLSSYGLPVNLWAPGSKVPVPVNRDGSIGHCLMNGTSAATPHVAGIAAIMLSFLGEQKDSTAATDSYSVRLSLMGNAKRDFIQGLSPDSRNLLANTGIHSRNDDEVPFATYPHPRDSIVELMTPALLGLRDEILRGREPEDEDDKPDCLPSNDPERIPLEDAEILFLRLLWEQGHYADYDNKGKPQPIVPCYQNSCAYFRSKHGWNLEDVGNSLPYMLHILLRCREPKTGKRSDQTTGGWMPYPQENLQFGLGSKA